MESQEGKNSNLSDASSAKYDIQVGPVLWASCAKNRVFFPVPQQLGRNGVLPGNHGFFSFRHWLLVEPLEWNEIRIPGDLSSPLTRNRLSLCRRLLPNGIIARFFLDLQRRLTPPPPPSFLLLHPRLSFVRSGHCIVRKLTSYSSNFSRINKSLVEGLDQSQFITILPASNWWLAII